jgi:hypothetical protein
MSQNLSVPGVKSTTENQKSVTEFIHAHNNQTGSESGPGMFPHPSSAPPVPVPPVRMVNAPPLSAYSGSAAKNSQQASSAQAGKSLLAAGKTATAPTAKNVNDTVKPAKNVNDRTDKPLGSSTRPPQSLEEQMAAAKERSDQETAQRALEVARLQETKDAKAFAALLPVKAKANSFQIPTAPADRGLIIPRIKPGVALATHNSRVSHLLRAGWQYDDVLAALEASQGEDGEEDIDAAQENLENLHRYRLENINALARRDAVQIDDEPEEEERIKAGSEVALYIATHLDDLDVVLTLMDIHEQATGNVHGADRPRCIANLMTARKTRQHASGRLSLINLKKAVSAVIDDCKQCEHLREQDKAEKQSALEQAEKLSKQKADAKKRKDKDDAAKVVREAEEEKKRRTIEAKHPAPSQVGDHERSAWKRTIP